MGGIFFRKCLFNDGLIPIAIVYRPFRALLGEESESTDQTEDW